MTGFGPATNPDYTDVHDSACLQLYIAVGQTSPTSVKIHDNTIGETQADALIINGFKGSLSQKLEIYDNVIFDGGENNIDMKSSEYFYIYNNTFSRNWEWGGSSGDDRTEGLILVHDDGGTGGGPGYVYNNFFNGNHDTDDGEYGPGVWVAYDSTDNIHIYNNYFLDCYPAVLVTQGADNAKIYNNLIVGSTNPTRVFYGDSVDDFGNGIYVGGANALNTLIYNNTIYIGATNLHKGINLNSLSGSPSSTIVKNNAIQMTATNGYSLYINTDNAESATNINYNLYYNGNDTERVYNRGTPVNTFGANDVNDNPDFTTPGSDFTLQAGSPCIDVGANLGVDYDDGWNPATDLPPLTVTIIDQDSRGVTPFWEIGAYVYDSDPVKITITPDAAGAITITPDAGGAITITY